jgi:hypothetical protein
VEQSEVEIQIGDVEVAIDRLRSLYDQYFMGIERIEPAVARKDVDRRIYLLRKEQIRNTALRFRFQMILQRYNMFQSHWQRVCREIENGTYKRHVVRAEQRFGRTGPKRRSSAPPAPATTESSDPAKAPSSLPPPVAASASQGLPPVTASASQGLPPIAATASAAQGLSRPPPLPGAPSQSHEPGRPLGPPRAKPEPGAPLPDHLAKELAELDKEFAPASPQDDWLLTAARRSPLARPPAVGPRPLAGQPAAPPRTMTFPPPARVEGAPPPRVEGAPGPRTEGISPRLEGTSSTGFVGSLRSLAPPLPGPRVAPSPSAASPPPPVPARTAAPANPGPAAQPAAPSVATLTPTVVKPPTPALLATMNPGAAKPSATAARPAPSAATPTSHAAPASVPAPKPAAPVVRPPSIPVPRPAAKSAEDGLSDNRVRQLYVEFVEAKRRQNESTAAITYDAVAKNLRDSSERLRQRHGKPIDFEITIRDGKAFLKPVLK